MRALVTGATGFIGRKLIARLDKPIALTRSPDRARKILGNDVETLAWDPVNEPAPKEAIEKVDTVFHLLGDPVAEGRWNPDKKKAILESRVESTKNLVETFRECENRPKVFVSASAIGYYGNGKDEILNEQSKQGSDFLSDVCAQWESASKPAAEMGIRVVNPRIGIVLGPDGGPLKKMLPPFKMGVGGPVGSGSQWMGWVHWEDLVGILLHAAKSDISGPINGVSPVPVTNREFSKTLAAVLKRPAFFPAPAPVLRLAFGEMADALLLISQRCVPSVAQQTGFEFKHPNLLGALQDILLAKRKA